MSILFRLLLISLAALISLVARAQQPSLRVAVEIQYCGMKPGKPPLKYLSFDVILRNRSDKPQWYLFPSALYDKPGGIRKNAGIAAIELLADSAHKVTVVDFLGTMNLQPEGAGGLKGILLPAKAVVSVHGFGIEYWGEPLSPLPLRVVIADRLKIGGTPVEQWVGKTLLSAKTADVKDLSIAASKEADDMKELSLDMARSGEVSIADALARNCR
jgi:hypothetical protein